MSLLASSIANNEDLAVFDQIWAERMAALPVNEVLVYLFDQVNADALFILAQQFDLTGYKGWRLTTTEADRRSLISRAIELHRTKGTPFAIKQAIRSIGLYGAEIEEGVSAFYNGDFDYDGTISHGFGNWALFRITFDLGELPGINAEQTAALLALVQEYKNARSILIGYGWRATIIDEVNVTETVTMAITVADITNQMNGGVYYNLASLYNGSYTYSELGDSVIIDEIT